MTGPIPYTIRTPDRLKELVKAYLDFDEFCFDVETMATRPSRDLPGASKAVRDKPALDSMTNRVFWIGLAGPGRVDIIPMGHPVGPRQLKRAAVFDALYPLFFSERRKIGHNVKFDVLSIAKYYEGEVPPPPYGDTQTLIHLLNENWATRGGFNLENLSLQYLEYVYDEKLGDKVPKVDFKRACKYVRADARNAWGLWQLNWPRLNKRPRLRALYDMEMGVLEVLLTMYRTGAYVDRGGFQALLTDLQGKIRAAQGKVFSLAGKEFNLNSPKQRSDFFYHELGLRCDFFTDKGAESTNAQALEKLAKENKVAKALLDYASLNKLLGTYVEGYIPHIQDDERIRASFNQSIPVTGRFSCSGPNLQNIPARHKESYEGKVIRGLFTAPEGHVLIVGDYGQIELRVLAHLTKDPTLLRAYREGLDLHVVTASSVFGVPERQVSAEQRAIGKTSNFNLAFEGGPGRIMEAASKDTPISEAMAQQVYDAWHRTYPGVKRWGRAIKEFCWDHEYVETLYGRKRRLPEIKSRNPKLAGYAERQAVNHPIQGTAADIAKHAMVLIHEALLDTPANLILQVHDEFVVESPEAFAEEGLQLVRSAMESVTLNGKPVLQVPLLADVHIGKTWRDAK